MVDPAALEEFKRLEQEKEKLENELKSLQEYLTEDGMPGISGTLLDEEGFPRADLDIYAIRKARNRLACAQTDHVEVMKTIEQLVQAIHSGSRVHVPRRPAPSVQKPSESGSGSSPASNQALLTLPFALIDEVSAGSPAEEAGLEIGDQVCRFGHVSLQDTGDLNECFKAIAQLVPQSAGKAVAVVVVRGSPPARVEIQLTPRTWAGRGLLGCHMAPKTL